MAEQDFTDGRTIMVRHTDERLAAVWGDGSAGFEQAFDGPTFIVIGPSASDDELRGLSNRFGIELATMAAFRDSDARFLP